jgi:TPR repeat protein
MNWVKSKALLLGLTLTLLAQAPCPKAAEIEVSTELVEGGSVITIIGPLQESDIKKFRDVAVPLEKALVLLKSNGGPLQAAIEIGRSLRLKGFSTMVDENACLSACALIWLSGERRFMGNNAKIGFHAAYKLGDNGPEILGSSNALIGGYLANLGFNDSVIAFATKANPKDMTYLTPAIAQQIGLQIDDLSDDQDLERAIGQFNLAAKPKDKGTTEAVRLYWHSAQAGFAGAQNNLGDLYELGKGVPASEGFAIYWYARAAERGEPTAYFSLATILAKGNPDSGQLVEAMKFAILAVEKLPGKKNRQRAQVAKDALGSGPIKPVADQLPV